MQSVDRSLRYAVEVTDATGLAAAYARGLPVIYRGNTDIDLNVDPSTASTDTDRFTILNNAIAWHGKCSVLGYGRIVLKIAAGLHKVSGYIQRNRDQPILKVASATYSARTITAISFATTGTAFKSRATITVSSALPSYVVAGYPIGLRNVQGDNDAAYCSGGHIVVSVAANLLSFTVDFYHPNKAAPLTDPTTIDSATHATRSDPRSMNRSEVIVPGAAIMVTGGYDGSAVEGFVNVEYGGAMESKYMGWAYGGAAGGEHDLFFIGDLNASIRFMDQDVVVGAADKVIRWNGASSVYMNRGFVGGGGIGLQLLAGASGGNANIIRSNYGNALVQGLTTGGRANIQFQQSLLTACSTGLQCDQGGTANMQLSVVQKSTIGFRANGGTIDAGTDCGVDDNTTQISLNGGRINGPIYTVDADYAVTASLASSNVAADTLYRGGGWYQTAATTPAHPKAVWLNFTQANAFGSIAANSYGSFTITATGVLLATDYVHACQANSAIPAGVRVWAEITANDEITVYAHNFTAGAINVTNRTYRVEVRDV